MSSPNLYGQFEALLRRAPLLIGQIAEVGTDGSSTIELPGGQQFRARGGAGLSVGDWVYVREGEIRGEAPALSIGADQFV